MNINIKKYVVLFVGLLAPILSSSCSYNSHNDSFLTWTSHGAPFTPQYGQYGEKTINVKDTTAVYFSNNKINKNFCQDLLLTQSVIFSDGSMAKLTYNIWLQDINTKKNKVSFLIQIDKNDGKGIIFEIKAQGLTYEPQYASFIEAEPMLYFVPKNFELERGKIRINDLIWSDTSWNIEITTVTNEGYFKITYYSWKTFIPEDQKKLEIDGIYFIICPFYFFNTKIVVD